jgi:hypothetical protein
MLLDCNYKNVMCEVGNGLALLGLTTVVCELVLMNFIHVKAHFFLLYFST